MTLRDLLCGVRALVAVVAGDLEVVAGARAVVERRRAQQDDVRVSVVTLGDDDAKRHVGVRHVERVAADVNCNGAERTRRKCN